MDDKTLLAARFRALADRFRAASGRNLSDLGFAHLNLEGEAGELLITAFRKDCLPAVVGLREVVELCEKRSTQPETLFRFFCGTNHVLEVGSNGVRIPPDARIQGGLLPLTFPDALAGARVNTVEARESFHAAVCEWLAEAVLADTADNKTDKKKNSVPSDPDVLRLAKTMQKELPKGRTKADIALEFANGDEQKAERFLRQLRRYRDLLK